MKRIILLFIFFSSLPTTTRAFSGLYVGWEPFSHVAMPIGSSANSFVFGAMGNTATRVYFYYHTLGSIIGVSGSVSGFLGGGIDIAGGVGYRFFSATHKRSGWDMGMDAFFYLAPYFLNSGSGFTETTLYYGAGLGLYGLYKINPKLGVGFRATFKYIIGTHSFNGKFDSAAGIGYSGGLLITF